MNNRGYFAVLCDFYVIVSQNIGESGEITLSPRVSDGSITEVSISGDKRTLKTKIRSTS